MLANGPLTGAPVGLQGNPAVSLQQTLTSNIFDPTGQAGIQDYGIPIADGTITAAYLYTENVGPNLQDDLTLVVYDSTFTTIKSTDVLIPQGSIVDGTVQTVAISRTVQAGDILVYGNILVGGSGIFILGRFAFLPDPTRAA